MNLGNNRTRTQRQTSKISNRRSIIDDSRNTRALAVEVNASLRNARRGDGGAQELLRSLGMLQAGGEALAETEVNKYIDQEQDNAAQGVLDSATGAVDEEMLQKSDGYRNAVTRGRTVTNFTKAAREFADELDELVEQQESPLLEDRRAEALAMTEKFFTEFATDPETGEFREFLQSPGAMRYLGEAIQTARPQFETNALARIEERFNREALAHFSQNLVDQVEEEGTFDLEAARLLLPETVTDEEVSEALIQSVFNAFDTLKANDRRNEALKLIAGLRGRTNTPLTGEVEGSSSEAPSVPLSEIEGALRMPVQGRVSSGFGPRTHPVTGKQSSHNGVDIAVPVGTPVNAAMGGEVVRAWTADAGGISLKVKYDDGTVAGFAHLSEHTVTEGRFEAGAQLALTGNTGRSTGPHLHYTITRDGQKVDPRTVELDSDFVPTQGLRGARLTDPNADPVTALESTGEIAEIAGLEGVTFTAQQTARINNFYNVASSELRREWQRADDERQSGNATDLMLGLITGNGRVTAEDIRTAAEGDEISTDHLLMLTRAFEAKQDRLAAEAERRENRAEREERRRRERAIQAGSEVLIGRLIRGDLTAPEARQAAILAASDVSDVEVAASILTNVNAVTNLMESAVMRSEPVVRQLQDFERRSDSRATRVRSLVPNLPQYRYKALEEVYRDGLDQAAGRYQSLVAAGADPEVAAIEAEILLTELETEIIVASQGGGQQGPR